MRGTITKPEKTIIIRRKSELRQTATIPRTRETIKLERPIGSRRSAGAPTAPAPPKSQLGITPPTGAHDVETAAMFPELEFHRLAGIFPLPPDSALQALANDIAANGLRDPITIFDGKILDGRSRYLACKRAGVRPRFETYTGNDRLGFVLSRNLHRRQLTERQRQLAAARAATLPVGANQTTPGLSIGRAAKLFNVSARSIARVKTILRDGSAELVQAFESGRLPVSRAAELVKFSREAQITALRELAEGKRRRGQKALPEVPKEDIKLDQGDRAPAPERSPSAGSKSETGGSRDRHADPNNEIREDEAAYARLMAAWAQASSSVQMRFYNEVKGQIAASGNAVSE